jgi:bacitracin transport system permease protein
MLLISFLGALTTPLMMAADAVKIYYSGSGTIVTLADLYDSCSLYTMLLFGFIVYVVIESYLFSREYTEKTLKTILAVPVAKEIFILGKFVMLFIWVMALTLITWLSMFIFAAIYNFIFGLNGFGFSVAIEYFIEMVFGGALLYLTITPFAFLALWTKGLVVPIIVAAAVLMGNMALSNEALGALFPWTASLMLIRGSGLGYPYPLVVFLVAGTSVFGFIASMVYFQKEDIK